MKWIYNVIDALDVTTGSKQFRIPRVWKRKRWLSEVREAAARRDEAYTSLQD